MTTLQQQYEDTLRENAQLRDEVTRLKNWQNRGEYAERFNKELKGTRDALRNLYDAGRWMLPTETLPLDKQIALWDDAKKALRLCRI